MLTFARRMRGKIALFVSILLAVGTGTALTPAVANAQPTGEITDFAIEITGDDTYPGKDTNGNPHDNDPLNGRVGLNSNASFFWQFNASNAQDATITQTLPEGWAWNEDSVSALLTGNADGLSRSYTLSDDKRTLVATVGNVGSGQTSVRFGPLVASPSLSVEVGSVYAPVVTVTDSRGDLPPVSPNTEPTQLTVVGAKAYDMDKLYNGMSNTQVNLGNGDEPVLRVRYRIETFYNERLSFSSYEFADTFRIQVEKPGENPVPFTPKRWEVSLSSYYGEVEKGSSFGDFTIRRTSDSALSYEQVEKEGEPLLRSEILYNVDIPISEMEGYPEDTKFTISNSIKPVSANAPGGVPLTEIDPENDNANDVTYTLKWNKGSRFGYSSLRVGDAGKRSPSESEYIYNDAVFNPEVPFTLWNHTNVYQKNETTGEISSALAKTRKIGLIGAGAGYQQFDPSTARVFIATSDAAGDPYPPTYPGVIDKSYVELPPSAYTIEVTTDEKPYVSTDSYWVAFDSFAGDRSAITGVRAVVSPDVTATRPYVSGTNIYDMYLGVDTSMTRQAVVEQRTKGGYELRSGHTVLTDGRSASWSDSNTVYVGQGHLKGSISVTNPTGTEKSPLVAGESASIETTTEIKAADVGIFGDDTYTNIEQLICLPSDLIRTINTSTINESVWQIENTDAQCPEEGRTGLLLKYVANGGIAKSGSHAIAPVKFDVRLSPFVPDSAVFNADVYWRGDGMVTTTAVEGWNSTTSGDRAISLSQAARHVKETATPRVERKDTASYTVGWYNSKNTSMGKSYFLDVLPYVGDKRGTNAPSTLRAVTMERGNADKIIFEYTTADPTTIGQLPADNVQWTAFKPGDKIPAGVSALRFTVNDFAAGEDTETQIRLDFDVTSATGGSKLQNTMSGLLRADSVNTLTLGEAAPVTIDIVASSISGKIVKDANQNGQGDSDEGPMAGVTVRLLDASGKAITGIDGKPLVATTNDSGAYTFKEVLSGEYVIAVEAPKAQDNTVWVNTFNPQGKSAAGRSAPIALGQDEKLEGQDFGLFLAAPALKLTKQGTLKASPAPKKGESIDYTFTVENTGNVVLKDVTLTDTGIDFAANVTWPDKSKPGVLAPKAKATATGKHTLTQDDIDKGTYTNNASASGISPQDKTVSDSANVPTPLPAAPAVTIEKTGKAKGNLFAGDTVTYTFTVKNTGNVTLTNLAVNDPLLGGQINTIDKLIPGESKTFTRDYKVTQKNVDEGTVLNTATVTGKSPKGGSVTGKDDANVALPEAGQIKVEKSGALSSDANPKAGDVVTWTFTVTNPGNVTVSNIKLEDNFEGLSAIEVTKWPGAEGVLAPKQTVKATATSTLTQEQIDNAKVDNTVAVNGTTPKGRALTDSSTATVPLPNEPLISLEKSGSINDEEAPRAGDLVTWEFRAENTGNVTLHDVEITDERTDVTDLEYTWPGEPGELAPGEVVTAKATTELTQEIIDSGIIENGATVAGESKLGGQADAQAQTSVDLPPAPAMTLSKTAVIENEERPAAGETITWNFELVNTGNVTLSSIALTDEFEGLSEIALEWPGEEEGILLPGESVKGTATSVITQEQIDAGSVENTASATGVTPGGDEVSETPGTEDGPNGGEITVTFVQVPKIDFVKEGALVDNARIDYTFTLTNSGNTTVHGLGVVDEMAGLSEIVYEWPGEAGVLAPGQQATATAHRTITEADRGTTLTNTAHVIGDLPGDDEGNGDQYTSDPDSVSVKVPAPESRKLSSTGVDGQMLALLTSISGMFLLGGIALTTRRKEHDVK